MAAVLDGATDGAVLAFAAWTIFYQLALRGGWSVWIPAALWIGVAALLVLGCSVCAMRVARTHGVNNPPKAASRSTWVPLALAGLVVLLVVLRPLTGLVTLVVGCILVLLLGLVWYVREGAISPAAPGPRTSNLDDGLVVVVGLGAAVLASRLLKPDADDTFFLNRSVWVAEHGVPSLRDTLYGPEMLPSSYAGGTFQASVETLLGALAHLVGVSAGTLVYLVALPVLAFATTWTIWRLSRRWARRFPLVVFCVAAVFILMSGESTVGSYSLGRLWQGKAFAFAMLTPLMWVYLTELADTRRRWWLLLLAAAGTSFVGLTSTASLQVPMVAGPVLVVALLVRDRLLALGALVLVAPPLIHGLTVVLGSVPVAGEEPVPLPAETAFGYMNGLAPGVVALSLVGVTVGPLLTRRGVVPLVGAASMAALVLFLPGMFDLLNTLTGAGPVLWRMLLGVPTAVLVGLLVTLPFRLRSTVTGSVQAALLTAALVTVALAAGTPQWSPVVGARLTSSPTWKVDQRALADVRALDRVDVRDGPWLLPPLHMEVLPIHTADRFSVVPRAFYLPGPEVRPGDQDARVLLYLTEAANGSAPLPGTTQALRAALDQLDVALMCALREDRQLLTQLEELSHDVRRFGGVRCVSLDGDGRPAAWG